MGIKNKPMGFQAKEMDEFRSYDPEVPQKKEEKMDLQNGPGMNTRITKTLRMRQKFSYMLKEEAHRQSMSGVKKVSESDLLDEALDDFRFKLQMKRGD